MIKVTVIIPTYGMPIFLESAIQSVLKQTLKELELIIVDDNNPNTESRFKTEVLVNRICQSDSRVIYVKHEKNMNGSVARNTGFSMAKGKYIALLDSDDAYMPDRLQKCYNTMETSSEKFAGVYTGCEFRRNGKPYNKFKNVKTGNFLVETLACTFMFCSGSNVFVRKNVVDELGGFDPSFQRQQDYEFLVRLFERYSLIAISEILVVKNQENYNLPTTDRQIAIRKQYLNKFQKIIENLDECKQKYIFRSQAISLAEGAMRNKNYKIANLYYGKANRYGRLTTHEWLRRIMFPIFTLFHK